MILQQVATSILLLVLIYTTAIIRKWWKNNCVKCGRQFWNWNLLDRRKACFPCRGKIDK